jgi:PAS domain S-box-containing protein
MIGVKSPPPPHPENEQIGLGDTTPLKAAERLINAARLLLDRVAEAEASPEQIFEAIALFVNGQAAGINCSILLVTVDGSRLEYATAPGFPEDFIEQTDGIALSDLGTAATLSIMERDTIVVTSIAADERMRSIRDLALAYGFGSCWATPIVTREGRVAGTISVFCRSERSPDAHERGVVESASRIAAMIIERLHAEEEARDSHEQMRQLLEQSPAVIYSLAVEGQNITPRLTSANVTRLLGFAMDETMSFDWWFGQLHPEDIQAATDGLQRTLNEGMSRTEYRLRHKDGSYRWVEDNHRLIRDSRGEPREIVGVWVDITDRRVAQDTLRVSEQRFSDMLSNVQDVSMMLDREARINYCNDSLLRLTGWERKDLIGRDWFELFVAPETTSELKEVFAALLVDSPSSWSRESEILTRSGEKRLIHWNNKALRSPAGEVVGVASVGEDITEKKSLEKQLLRAQRLESLGTLASGMAHDLNNLFMPILMGATLIKRFQPTEGTRKAIENIERAVKRGTDLVKQVLLFARGVEGSHVAIDVSGIITEVEAIAHSTFPKNVAFVTSIGRPLPPLTGDPTQLMQVLLNLCVNARDALQRGGQITVSATSTDVTERFATLHGGSGAGPYVALEVADSGSGMSQTVVDRIFEPFFTTKALGHGTGLGLSSAQGIVRSHGGFMTVSSEIGRGSTFGVYLPVRSESVGLTAIAPPADEEPPRGNGELILVVDDEIEILEITRQTLEAFGFEVLTAEDGAQAIDLYVRHRAEIALVLTDMMMPVIDGPALIGVLRRMDPAVRVIAASGLGEPSHAAGEPGALTPHFLVKPFSADLMVRTVAEVLRKGNDIPSSV